VPFEEAHVFDRISGLPAHPLIVHAAVVFVPLLVLGAIGYAVLPFLRRQMRWPVGLVAVVAAASIFAAHESGEDFSGNKNFSSPQMKALIATHEGYADKAQWFTFALAAVTLIMLFLVGPGASVRPGFGSTSARSADETSGPGGGNTLVAERTRTGTPVILQVVLAVAAIALALVDAYYCYKTGDSGAHMAWAGY
jgi:hypothetical protein